MTSSYKLNDEQEQQKVLSMIRPFMSVVKNDSHGRVELHLRGEFGSPQASTLELTELTNLSEVYPTCVVYINSIGGRVDLLREIVAILEKFQNIITVVTSNANSAGLMLWGIGDLRVVCPHAELMAHREMSGYMDKTDAFIGRGEFLKRRFELMFNDMCGGILTDEEIDKARFTEVWLLGQDMIDRGVAISWEQFHVMDTTPVESMRVISRNGQLYVQSSDGDLMKANVEFDQSTLYSFLDVMYGDESPTDDIEESEPPIQQSPFTQKIENGKFVVSDSDTTKIAPSEIRFILRTIFGKGNFKVGRSIEAKILNSFYIISNSRKRSKFYDDLNDFLEMNNITIPNND